MKSPGTDSTHSSHREKLIEHIFLGEILRELWIQGICDAEVLSSEVDAGGYDLVLESNAILRHIQLKSSASASATSKTKVSLNLAAKPSGCVIWIIFEKSSMKLGPFLWFGDAPGHPLPSISDYKVAKHTRGDARGVKKERPNQRMVPRSKFEEMPTIGSLVKKLFG